MGVTATEVYKPHLLVVEHAVDVDGLGRRLRELDQDLFLDKEWDAQFEMFVWSVKLHMGPQLPPHLVTDWRDPLTRRPLELSHGLLYKVQQIGAESIARTRPLRDEVLRENEDRQRKLAEENEENYRDLALDMIPRIKGLKTTVMPRSRNVAAGARRQRRRDLERYLGLR